MAVHLTFDIDWAPDWAIDVVLDILTRKAVKATFLITHATDRLRSIQHEGHEVGIHPNFDVASTQGGTVEAVMAYLEEIAPNARVMRSHGLLMSTAILERALRQNKHIQYDLSLLTLGVPLTTKIPWRFNGQTCDRLNYSWEDDLFFDTVDYGWRPLFESNSLAIANFHPIHVSLNTSNFSQYDRYRSTNVASNSTGYTAKQHVFANSNESARGAYDALMYTIENHECISFEELLCELES